MPHGNHYPLSPVIDHVVRLAPRSVLDVGIGYGKWGLLIREALDWVADRHDRADWQTTIDGIEIFEGYRSPLYDWVYDRVDYGDIRGMADSLPPYDLVLIADVIEHMTKDDGIAVLRTLLGKCRNVIVSTPVDFFEQQIQGNEHEHHLSLWELSDFTAWQVEYDVFGSNTIVAALAGEDATWPTSRETRASELAYRLSRTGSIGPRLVKTAARRLPS